jgi:hypothetical protein
MPPRIMAKAKLRMLATPRMKIRCANFDTPSLPSCEITVSYIEETSSSKWSESVKKHVISSAHGVTTIEVLDA